ncbi:hypothetical protein B9G53_02140 [Pseudanabaena sp. SR411]|uniref:fascin domain-containing protein n=1 Tax=Pseudanabaena sp. SR411 TaxID=1980935 RepID=UPI000B996942|nr:hypothetical protein [Pseudanabaena sp. SR411]OYQ67175.1 hypothetical protein B9G53_02140 [Pseudanabaena sp. SR411]
MSIDDCNAVLAGDLFNKSISSITQEQNYVSSLAFFHMGESEAFTTYQNWVSKNGGESLNIGARFPFEGFPVGIDIAGKGSRAFTTSEFREAYSKWKNETSFSRQDNESFSFASHFATFVRDPNTIEAWRVCVDRVSSNQQASINGYGFRDESGNAFIRIKWNPGPILILDKAFLNIDTFGETSIGGTFHKNFRLSNGDSLFPVITNEDTSFTVLVNVTIRDGDTNEQKTQFSADIVIPRKIIPDNFINLKPNLGLITLSLITLETRRGFFFNCHNSVGSVQAIANANFDPAVSDEIFSIVKLGDGSNNQDKSINSEDKVLLRSRRGFFFNCHDSVGSVQGIANANFDPAVSDEIFTIVKNGGGIINSGDKILFRSRRGFFFNCHDSVGSVQGIANANFDPAVSDEIFTIVFR